MKNIQTNAKKYAPYLFFALLAGFLYNYLFYPWVQTPDALFMLSQVKNNWRIDTWHPPFITALWGVFYRVFGSETAVWEIQLLLYIIACFYLSISFKRHRVSIIFFALFILYPPIFNNMGILWKDSWALIFTTFLAAFSIRAIQTKKLTYFIGVFLFFLMASLSRYDLVFLAFPMVVIALYSLFISGRSLNWTNFGKFGGGVLVAIFTVSLAIVASQELAARKRNPWMTVAVWDIIGVNHFAKIGVTPPGYNFTSSDELVFVDNPIINTLLPGSTKFVEKPEEARFIRDLWLNTIINHPIAYAKHRFTIMLGFVSFGGTTTAYFEEPNEVKTDQYSAYSVLYKLFHLERNGIMYRYWYYIALSSLIFFYYFIRRQASLAQTAIYLSLLGAFSRFIILPSIDFRYGLWMVPATLILIALIFEQKSSNS